MNGLIKSTVSSQKMNCKREINSSNKFYFTTRGIQIKMTLKVHLQLGCQPLRKTNELQNLTQIRTKGNLTYFSCPSKTVQTLWKPLRKLLEKLKMDLSYSAKLLLSIFLEQSMSTCHRNTYTSKFIAKLLTRVGNRTNIEFLSRGLDKDIVTNRYDAIVLKP